MSPSISLEIKGFAAPLPSRLDKPCLEAFGLVVGLLLLVHRTRPAWCHMLQVLQRGQRVGNRSAVETGVRGDSAQRVADRPPKEC